MGNLLYWAVIFLIIALVAAFLGFGGVAGVATDGARICDTGTGAVAIGVSAVASGSGADRCGLAADAATSERHRTAESLLRHDWIHRWKRIFQVSGIEPSPGMTARVAFISDQIAEDLKRQLDAWREIKRIKREAKAG